MDSDAILTAVNAVESITNPPHTPERSSYRARKTVEQIIHLIFLLCGIVAVAFVLLISIYLILSGLPAIRQIGLFQFLLGKVWDPTNTTTGAQYGILPFILTSVYGTAGAIVIGVPVGLLTAVFLAKVAPPKLAAVIRTAVQLLAGIPSVVYGLVGMIVLVPAIRNLFHLSSGACLLAAMIVLAYDPALHHQRVGYGAPGRSKGVRGGQSRLGRGGDGDLFPGEPSCRPQRHRGGGGAGRGPGHR